MTLITRTAIIQARVFPSVKQASEAVLWRIGLNMSEAMELFLRRVIVDEGIPFQVVALDAKHLDSGRAGTGPESSSGDVSSVRHKPGGGRKKNLKSFSAGTPSRHIPKGKRSKKRPV